MKILHADGLSSVYLYHTGSARAQSKAKCPSRSWDETKASSQVTTSLTLGFGETLQWRLGEHVIAQSGDLCRPGSWVFIRQSEVRSNRIRQHMTLTVNSKGVHYHRVYF